MNVDEAERWVSARLRVVGLERRPDYTTGEAARIIGVSRLTVRRMIERFEPETFLDRDRSGLLAIRLRTHHKIPHLALVDWFTRNSAYSRVLQS